MRVAVRNVSPNRDSIVIEAECTGLGPNDVFDYWTKPDLLKRWWPEEAEIDPRVGGAYHLSWPKMDWHLRGRYTAFDPGRALAFTWAWDHEPEVPETSVAIAFAPTNTSGTGLTIEHGPYSDSEQDQKQRDGHVEGWTYFISRLEALQSKA
jgi:uncharacterized protein YndB with AHSA1/START domain